MLNQKKVEIFSRKFRKSLAKQFLEVALTIFCGGDIKLSVMVVLRTDVSQARNISSHLRSDTSQRVFLCRSKAAARALGKRFGGGIYIFEKKLTKVFGN